jgi:hypothetical protein
MLLGQELFVLKIANKISATKPVTDAEEHPLLSQLKYVRAGDVLVSCDPKFLFVKIWMEQLADVVPVREIVRLHDHRRFLATHPVQSVVGAVVDPDIGIKVTNVGHELAILITRRHFMRLAPLIQVVVETIRNPVPIRSLPVINHGRPAVFRDKARSAEHAMPHGWWSQHRWVPGPMNHVLTRDVGERKTEVVPVDVVQVIATLPEEGRIGVTRHRFSGPGMRQVVSQPARRWVRWHRRGLDSRLRYLRTAHGGEHGKEEGSQDFLYSIHGVFSFHSVAALE